MNLQEEYRRSTIEFFAQPMVDLIKRYDQQLFETADKAESNEEQNRSFEAMREFRVKSIELEQRFSEYLSQGLEAFFERQ